MPESTFDNPKIFIPRGKTRAYATFHRWGGKMIMTRAKWMWMQHHGNVKANCEIDHIDGDCTNDEIGNLRCMSRKRHVENHRALNRKSQYAAVIHD